MSTIREIIESPLVQGADESIAYVLTTTPWGSSPTSVAVKVYDVLASDTDVTSTIIPSGTPSVNGDDITLPALKSMTAGKRYRVEIKFTCSGNTFETFAIVDCDG